MAKHGVSPKKARRLHKRDKNKKKQLKKKKK